MAIQLRVREVYKMLYLGVKLNLKFRLNVSWTFSENQLTEMFRVLVSLKHH